MEIRGQQNGGVDFKIGDSGNYCTLALGRRKFYVELVYIFIVFLVTKMNDL